MSKIPQNACSPSFPLSLHTCRDYTGPSFLYFNTLNRSQSSLCKDCWYKSGHVGRYTITVVRYVLYFVVNLYCDVSRTSLIFTRKKTHCHLSLWFSFCTNFQNVCSLKNVSPFVYKACNVIVFFFWKGSIWNKVCLDKSIFLIAATKTVDGIHNCVVIVSVFTLKGKMWDQENWK